jgi:hypothetical protein
VTDVAADPDLAPVRLVSVFNGGSPIGTVTISDSGTPTVTNDDVLVFTLTSATPGTVVLYWTISDGSLSAHASRTPPTCRRRTTADQAANRSPVGLPAVPGQTHR